MSFGFGLRKPPQPFLTQAAGGNNDLADVAEAAGSDFASTLARAALSK
jgi:hypothetical protein